ncbi:carbohydrate phosphatase [Massarina eburnea CBS 473.64]|uniref:Carbohydrate phosphatase n=1 Tax=Massarina eburnea CBS 473.64 TaxID=1395130 RepID=A0A6A6RUB6_9PLEO|nr:carbohydrate phosphatase [Massarina eburnea CBS 473.64]
MGSTQAPSLEAHLNTILPSKPHKSLRLNVIPSLLQTIAQVAKVLRTSSTVSQVGTANTFGDEQLNVDVLAEEAIRAAIADCPSILTASSEEDPLERSKGSCITPMSEDESEEKYTVAFDPLDGSSIIAPNWTVGTIIGIWEGETALNQSPAKQVAAILGVYGPRTTAVVAIRMPGTEGSCFEVGFDGTGALEMVRSSVKLDEPPFKSRYFAPANLRSAAEDPKYMGLITHFIAEKYTLRYSGGLVPDVVHALVKGHGVYVSPVTEKSTAKLRRLYELLPIALIVECAGGLAIDSATGERVLEKQVADTDERGGLVCGTREEVKAVEKALLA